MTDETNIELNTGEDSGATRAPAETAPPAKSQPSLADWQQLAAKEVKGRDLSWHTPEGIAVKPLYTAEDTADLDPGLPGFAPFTRGVRATMYAGGRGRSGNMPASPPPRSRTPSTAGSVPQAQLQGTIQNDILKEFAVRNTYIYPPEPSMRIVADIIAYTSAHMPKFNSISISGYHMQEAGRRRCRSSPSRLRTGWNMFGRPRQGPGSDAFRAAPFLLLRDRHELLHGGGEASRSASALAPDHGRVRREERQIEDASDALPDVRRLADRAGSLQQHHPHDDRGDGGGARGHAVAPHQQLRRGDRAADRFSARIARNTQLVLAEETGITNVADPLGGSYYVEALTQRLADEAWALIQEVESVGGMTRAVDEGMPKRRIEEASAARAAAVDRGETVIVGVNRYRLKDEPPIDTLEVDNARVRSGQIARIERVRGLRDEGAARAALDSLREGARGDANLLLLSIEAARARCTLGEISAALEDVFGRYDTVPKPVSGIYGGAYAGDPRWSRAEDGVEAVERRLGRRPRLLVAKMGQDGHDRGANLVASAFADLGFEVVPGPLFQTPEESARLAIERGVDVVGASSLAAGHKTLVPELINHLRDMGRVDIKVVVGGVIPPQDYEMLREAGVQAIFGPGTNLVDAAGEVLKLLGHNMPPLDEAAE
jgi:methylmalonyl-CoA mutase